MKLSIVIPVYNEEDTILSVIQNIDAVPLGHNLTKEIIVVDDGSTDKTKKILEPLKNSAHIHVFSFDENQGKTFAVKFGLQKTTGDIILIQDADSEYSPDHYPALIAPFFEGNHQVVYGSRFKGEIKNMTPVNRTANVISNVTINLLFGSKLSDFHCGFKLFKKEVIDQISINSRKFSFDTEITAKLLKKGFKIHEVPIQYVARKKGKKITWATALESYFILWKCRFSNKI